MSIVPKYKIKFNSFEDYVEWSVKKIEEAIPGLRCRNLVEDYRNGSHRMFTYEFSFGENKIKIDFEMEGNYEWYTGNKQEDPDWVYSPQSESYMVWGGVDRLAKRLILGSKS